MAVWETLINRTLFVNVIWAYVILLVWLLIRMQFLREPWILNKLMYREWNNLRFFLNQILALNCKVPGVKKANENNTKRLNFEQVNWKKVSRKIKKLEDKTNKRRFGVRGLLMTPINKEITGCWSSIVQQINIRMKIHC